jgi:hypothetical protein
MSLKSDLRGYLLSMAVDADDPIGLSSEDVHAAFASDYPDFRDFDDAFGNALTWLHDEALVRFHSTPSGTNGECTVIDLVATSFGEQAVKALAGSGKHSGGLHIEIARMIGAGLGEFVNTQK